MHMDDVIYYEELKNKEKQRNCYGCINYFSKEKKCMLLPIRKNKLTEEQKKSCCTYWKLDKTY